MRRGVESGRTAGWLPHDALLPRPGGGKEEEVHGGENEKPEEQQTHDPE